MTANIWIFEVRDCAQILSVLLSISHYSQLLTGLRYTDWVTYVNSRFIVRKLGDSKDLWSEELGCIICKTNTPDLARSLTHWLENIAVLLIPPTMILGGSSMESTFGKC